MSDAEATIRQVILTGLLENYPKLNEKTVDAIYKHITNTSVMWALREIASKENSSGEHQ